VGEWLKVVADDVTIKSVGDGAPGLKFSAPRYGRVALAAYFADIAEDWEMIFYHADEFIEQGDRVVMLGRCRFRHKRTGKEAVSPTVGVWRFRDGQAVEVYDFYDTAKALAATVPD
jgi:ketosteroid isomerase-like protein